MSSFDPARPTIRSTSAPMVEPVATRVDVGLFDLHIWMNPLAQEGLLREPLREFLVNGDGYQARHASGDPFEGEKFRITAPWRHFRHHHFWSDYLSALLPDGEDRDRWYLLVPFLCRPRDFRVEYLGPTAQGGAASVRAQVRTLSWLWPFGWSSNLEFVLQGEQSLEDVRDTVAALRGSACFRIGGEPEPRRLAEVFAELSRRMRSELGGPQPVKDQRTVDRSLVVSVSRLRDRMRCWDYTGYAGSVCGSLPFADRARLHAALLGREVTDYELRDLEGEFEGGAFRGRKFTITPFPGAGFGITHLGPGRGTLLFLSEVDPTENRANLEHCLASNVRTVSMTIEALLSVVRFLRGSASSTPKAVEEVVARARSNLAILPELYRNRFCKRMFEARGELAGVRGQVLGGSPGEAETTSSGNGNA